MEAIWADLTNIDNVFGHLTYVFLIASMSMTNMRWLRILALASGLTAMTHFIWRTDDTVSFVWEVIFTLTNGTQLALLLYRSRTLTLLPDQQMLADGPLAGIDSAELRQLFAIGTAADLPVDGVLMRQGDPSPPLIFVVSGAASVEVDGRMVSVCGPGDFLGEMSLMGSRPATATVRVTNVMHIISFDRQALHALRCQSEPLKTALDQAFSAGLMTKLQRMNTAAPATA